MLHRQPTYEEMAAALEASRREPDAMFERMIRNGIINRQGEVTRLSCGEAEPEPEALEYLAQKKNGNGSPDSRRTRKTSKRPKR